VSQMAYAVNADIRAMTGITTSELSDADLSTIMTIADRWVDNHSEGSPNANDKIDAGNCFASSIVMTNRASTNAESQLLELEGAFRIDARTAQTLRQGLSKQFFDRALYLLSAKSTTDLIQRVP